MTADLSKLRLECIAIGSVPHKDTGKAMQLVKENFKTVPFWPQMVKVSKNEDMILQFLEGMPSFFSDKSFLDTDYEDFYEDLENFYVDYETVISGSDEDNSVLAKYAISDQASCSFKPFLEIVKSPDVKYCKGQVVGPLTLSTTLVDKDGRCAIYDETLKDVILKTLSLKALWQIKSMKSANPNVLPVIFIDEPSISQLGTSAYVTISENSVRSMLEELSNVIQSAGAVSAIHCCGKCDWKVPAQSGVNMLNFDAYSFSENLSVYSDYIKEFLGSGGKIVWGLVPTLDKDALESLTIDILIDKFKSSVNYLTKKGIDEKLIIDNSLISTSCGAGSLSEELAEKALRLTCELSYILKDQYIEVI